MPPKRKEGSSSPPRTANHRSSYSFGGPLGVTVLTIFLPILTYVFPYVCNDISGCPAPALLHPHSLTLEKLKKEVGWTGFGALYSKEAFAANLGWYFTSLLLNTVLPAHNVEGIELASGGRLKYRLNAFSSAVVILSALGIGTAIYGAEFPVWTFISANFVQLLTSNLIISAALAIYVYVKSFSVRPNDPSHRLIAQHGMTGNMIYDWFIGRELNPRVTLPIFGEIDIKSFMEMRPGLLGWIVLDLAFMAQQYRTHGTVTDGMLIVCFSQAAYVLDGLYMEPAILTTIDITTDGFGYMLSFGDLVWVPFIYSLQARYLALHPVRLGLAGCAAVLAVQAAGYYVFRAANNEKDRFRRDPQDPRVKHLRFIQTKRGSRLLTSGWWGTARHVNYLGDWLMSWSYCLPTGVAGFAVLRSASGAAEIVPGEARGWGMLVTYFFMLYFAVLLVHRERRDEEKCRLKYGKDWETYRQKVPSRIIPYIY